MTAGAKRRRKSTPPSSGGIPVEIKAIEEALINMKETIQLELDTFDALFIDFLQHRLDGAQSCPSNDNPIVTSAPAPRLATMPSLASAQRNESLKKVRKVKARNDKLTDVRLSTSFTNVIVCFK